MATDGQTRVTAMVPDAVALVLRGYADRTGRKRSAVYAAALVAGARAIISDKRRARL